MLDTTEHAITMGIVNLRGREYLHVLQEVAGCAPTLLERPAGVNASPTKERQGTIFLVGETEALFTFRDIPYEMY